MSSQIIASNYIMISNSPEETASVTSATQKKLLRIC